MNVRESIVIAVILWFAFRGVQKGFVKKLAAMVSLVLSVVLVSLFLPYITDYLKYETPVYTVIEHKCEEIVSEKLAEQFPEIYGNQEPETHSPGRIEQTEIIENLPLPQELIDMLLDYNNSEGYSRLNVTGFQEYIVSFISSVILNVAAFLVSVLVVQLLLWAVIAALNLVASIPVIRFVNRLAGMGLGLIQVLFLIWVFFLILSMFSGTEAGMFILSLVQESEFLSEMYETNVFLDIVLRAAAILV